MKYQQVIDGDWVEPTPQRGHRMKCCDCSLIHVMDFRIKNGKVQFRPRRDKRATAAARRRATSTHERSEERLDASGWTGADRYNPYRR